MAIQPVDQYPGQLLEALLHLAPEYVANPTVAVLSPGLYHSAYFEHSFLAQQMGIELVEGRDLVKPGLTGIALVVNGYDNDIEGFKRKVAYDLLYLQNCCVLNDLKILVRTVRVVLTGEGAL